MRRIHASNEQTALPLVERIAHERDFKLACDGLLRFTLGPLVQLYASAGPDGGVDAEFCGHIGDTSGRWVFQYKFLTPAESVSKRRSRLRSIFCSSGKSEFDRPGVQGACGYVLLTNTPVTAQLVAQLRQAWQHRAPGKPLVVWDPAALNSMLKGHEHLARSWTGVKEARARKNIVEPLWSWINKARAVAFDWPHNPCWPIVMESTQEARTNSTFSDPFEWHYSIGIFDDLGDALDVLEDPQWAFASAVAYPRALGGVEPAVKAALALAKTIRREVDLLTPTVAARLPSLDSIEIRRRSSLHAALALAILEMRWGFPRALHRVDGDRLQLKGHIIAHEGPEVRGLEADLSRLVADWPHGTVPSAVERARNHLRRRLERCWSEVWYVVELGIDADSST